MAIADEEPESSFKKEVSAVSFLLGFCLTFGGAMFVGIAITVVLLLLQRFSEREGAVVVLIGMWVVFTVGLAVGLLIAFLQLLG